MFASILLDISRPNATTWFYAAMLLSIAIFFIFDRVFVLRNLDILGLFLIVPGFLFVQHSHNLFHQFQIQFQNLKPDELQEVRKANLEEINFFRWLGYIWLISCSLIMFIRCILDLGLERRPQLRSNLNFGGLTSLVITLCVGITLIAIERLPDSPDSVGRGPIAISKFKEGAAALVYLQSGSGTWDQVKTLYIVETSVALLFHFSIALALLLIGWIHFRDASTGMGMACLYLVMPCTAYYVTQIHHVWPTAFIAWAIFAYKKPLIAGVLLGIAAGSAFFPFLIFPLWFGFYRGRGTGKFTLGFLLASGFSLTLTAGILSMSGQLRQYWDIAIGLPDWQAWKEPKTEGIWQGTRWPYRLPVFIVYITFVVLTMFWPKPRNLGQVIAQTSAVIIGIQFWYADQGGAYVLWYLPLVILMIFRPNLTEARPPEIIANGKVNSSTASRLATIARRIFPKQMSNAA